MTPEIRRAALRAAAKTALVAALGCGGDPKPPPQNMQPKSPPIEVVEDPGPSATDLANKAKKDADELVAKVAQELEGLDKKVGVAVDAVVGAQNDADRAAAQAKLQALRKEKAEIEQRIAAAKAAVARAQKMAAAAPCIAHLDTLEQAKPDQLAADDPLRANHDVYGAFADAKLRADAKTQSCCADEMVAYGSSAKHRWACCSALGNKLPAEATPSACTPWGPPCPPEMA